MKHNPFLPGDLQPSQHLQQALRVNHTGEYGAVRIYQGQMAVLKDQSSQALVAEMLQQEQRHLDIFNNQLKENHVRPTFFQPLWHIAGYGLGVVTAALGPKAAMACTVAVEEVIDQHYQEQLAELPQEQQGLKNIIEECRQDECHHRDIALENKAQQAPAYPIIKFAVTRATKLAIWISKRI